MNREYQDYITKNSPGAGRFLLRFSGIAMAFVLAFVFAHWQANRLIGQWESPSGQTVLEFNRDGTARTWIYGEGWGDYREWSVNMATNMLHGTGHRVGHWMGNRSRFRFRGNSLELNYTPRALMGMIIRGQPAFLALEEELAHEAFYEMNNFTRLRTPIAD